MTPAEFETVRVAHRDRTQSLYRAWEAYSRAWFDSLTPKQWQAVCAAATSVAGRYAATPRVSRSDKVRRRAAMAGAAYATWQAARAEAAAHLAQDPDLRLIAACAAHPDVATQHLTTGV